MCINRIRHSVGPPSGIRYVKGCFCWSADIDESLYACVQKNIVFAKVSRSCHPILVVFL